MKLALILSRNDPETIWNAFRLANTSLAYDNEVHVFLLGAGVEAASTNSLKYNIKEQMDIFREEGGLLTGCHVCAESREEEMPFLMEDLSCDMGSMQDLYALVKDYDKVLSF